MFEKLNQANPDKKPSAHEQFGGNLAILAIFLNATLFFNTALVPNAKNDFEAACTKWHVTEVQKKDKKFMPDEIIQAGRSVIFKCAEKEFKKSVQNKNAAAVITGGVLLASFWAMGLALFRERRKGNTPS